MEHRYGAPPSTLRAVAMVVVGDLHGGVRSSIGPPQNDVVNTLVVLQHVPSIDDNVVVAPTAMPSSSSSSKNPPWTDLNSHPRSVKAASRHRSQQPPEISSSLPSPKNPPPSCSAFSSRAHVAVDSPHDVCFFVVTSKCLDWMIQATHLIGNVSPCRSPSTIACLDACIACPDACTIRCHRSSIVRPACTARCHCAVGTILSHSIMIDIQDHPIQVGSDVNNVGVGGDDQRRLY
ncbi:hypothetical protein ACLOJK_019441 [Asimina triloba]